MKESWSLVGPKMHLTILKIKSPYLKDFLAPPLAKPCFEQHFLLLIQLGKRKIANKMKQAKNIVKNNK